MAKSATELARELLDSAEDGLEELRIHEFPDDVSADDDELHEALHAGFAAAFDRVRAELAEAFGAPSRTGTEDDEVIPLNGVFRFAVWEVEGKLLYVAAAHEDRSVPILLMLGAAAGDRT
jgi:hypothetical protein